jgi:hypothetical protein
MRNWWLLLCVCVCMFAKHLFNLFLPTPPPPPPPYPKAPQAVAVATRKKKGGGGRCRLADLLPGVCVQFSIARVLGGAPQIMSSTPLAADCGSFLLEAVGFLLLESGSGGLLEHLLFVRRLTESRSRLSCSLF